MNRPRFAFLAAVLTAAAFCLLAGCRSTPPGATAPAAGEGPFAEVIGPWPGGAGEPHAAARTLDGHLMVGYQGWYLAAGDGSGVDWKHYGAPEEGSGRLVFRPGSTVIDYWPDMTEAGPQERYPTEFRHTDGSVATVFSSFNPRTVDRHFAWMAQYGIDGAFVQRFATALRGGPLAHSRDVVLMNARAGAHAHGRSWAVMYDLTGLQPGEIESVLIRDWRRLVDAGVIGGDPAYQRHEGRPVVAVWGVGFRHDRAYTLEECERLVDLLKDDPVYGGNTVMLGVPYRWLTLTGDAVADPALLRIIEKADIVSPWSVGRNRTPQAALDNAVAVVQPDLAWTSAHGLEYLPVIFPGFSWHNQDKARGGNAPLDWIPRLDGEFLWAQARAVAGAGASMIYLAMFDEMDEGTQIFKVTPTPPVGESPFLSYGDLPADHYLWLAGRIGALLDGEIEATAALPARIPLVGFVNGLTEPDLCLREVPAQALERIPNP